MSTRTEILNVGLVPRDFDYVDAPVPVAPFVRWKSDEFNYGDRLQIRHRYFYLENHEVVLALYYHVLPKEELKTWCQPRSTIPLKLAICQKKCAWLQTALPIQQAEPIEYVNGAGILFYFEADVSPNVRSEGILVFSSDPMTRPGRIEIQLRMPGKSHLPDEWKPLLVRIVKGIRIRDDATTPQQIWNSTDLWWRRKSRCPF